MRRFRVSLPCLCAVPPKALVVNQRQLRCEWIGRGGDAKHRRSEINDEARGHTYPDNIIRQSHDLVSRAFRHLRKALRLSLVLEGIAGEVNSCIAKSAHIRNRSHILLIENLPERCTSALTRIFTPPMPSNSISSSLLCLQSPMRAIYVLPVSYSLYPSARTTFLSREAARRRPLSDSIQLL